MKSSIVALAILAALGQANAAEIPVCPASITTRQSLTAVPFPFQVIAAPVTSKLKGVTIFERTPKGLALLDPDDETGTQSSWTFLDGQGAIFVRCSFEGTSVILQRQLNQNVAGCNVTYSAQGTAEATRRVIHKIDCK